MTTEIPHDHWPEFLGRFGNDHLGWRVTLQARRPGRGKLILVEDSSLESLMDDEDGAHEQISIVLGGQTQRHETHVIDDPTRVLLTGSEPSQRELEIDARDGTITVLSCRQPAA